MLTLRNLPPPQSPAPSGLRKANQALQTARGCPTAQNPTYKPPLPDMGFELNPKPNSNQTPEAKTQYPYTQPRP